MSAFPLLASPVIYLLVRDCLWPGLHLEARPKHQVTQWAHWALLDAATCCWSGSLPYMQADVVCGVLGGWVAGFRFSIWWYGAVLKLRTGVQWQNCCGLALKNSWHLARPLVMPARWLKLSLEPTSWTDLESGWVCGIICATGVRAVPCCCAVVAVTVLGAVVWCGPCISITGVFRLVCISGIQYSLTSAGAPILVGRVFGTWRDPADLASVFQLERPPPSAAVMKCPPAVRLETYAAHPVSLDCGHLFLWPASPAAWNAWCLLRR